MFEFRMPALGADMDTGILVAWRVAVGDRVERGQIVCEIETQKGNIEVELWETGVVDEIVVPRGQRVPVGEVLLRLRTEAASGTVEAAPAPPPTERPTPKPAAAPQVVDAGLAPAVAAVSDSAPDRPAAGPRPVRASPVARRRAAELHVGLAELTGTGPDGAITLADVEAAAARPPAAKPPAHRRVSPVARNMAEQLGVDLAAVSGSGPQGSVLKADVERAIQATAPVRAPAAATAAAPAPAPAAKAAAGRFDPTQMRAAIAAAMSRSKREIPHYYLLHSIDMSRALGRLAEWNRNRPVSERLLSAVLGLRAVALALRKFPEMNGFFLDGQFKPSADIHIGFAVALRGGGLVAPAIHHTDGKTPDELMTAMTDLVQRARTGKLRASEMSDPTITVTSLGEQGVEAVWGVITPPQVAVVGLGRIGERAWAAGGMVGARPIMTATLAADHRVSDGRRGALFLAEVARLLEEGEEL